jgi:hypothetical protein
MVGMFLMGVFHDKDNAARCFACRECSKMNHIKTLACSLLVILLINGCSSRNYDNSSYSKVEKKAEKREKKEKTLSIVLSDESESAYLREFAESKSHGVDKKIVKWIQPKNKKESCKIWTATNLNNDRTADKTFKIYWDGECKNGYAEGLGLEFEMGIMRNAEQIGIYEKGKVKGYCIIEDKLHNTLIEGSCNFADSNSSDHHVVTEMQNLNGNIALGYTIGSSGSITEPRLLTYYNPMSDIVFLQKEYPVFSYRFIDFTSDEDDQRRYEFELLNAQGKLFGYKLRMLKQNGYYAGKVIDGKAEMQNATVPQSGFDKINSIRAEIEDAGKTALSAQQQALLVKKQYRFKICKDNVKVSFMSSLDYKEICTDDKKYSEALNKIKEHRVSIDKLKAQKREETILLKAQAQSQEREDAYRKEMLRVQKQQAEALEDQATATGWANTQNFINNMQQNRQLQQINNNLMLRR